jgi:hypothetical protein
MPFIGIVNNFEEEKSVSNDNNDENEVDKKSSDSSNNDNNDDNKGDKDPPIKFIIIKEL